MINAMLINACKWLHIKIIYEFNIFATMTNTNIACGHHLGQGVHGA